MTWKNLIDGCFGVEDKAFAKHSLDRQRAAELLKECLEQGVTLEELCDELEKWLHSQIPSPQDQQFFNNHVKDQLDAARELFEPWLG